MNIEEMGFAEV